MSAAQRAADTLEFSPFPQFISQLTEQQHRDPNSIELQRACRAAHVETCRLLHFRTSSRWLGVVVP
jgi:hypothetical protein